MKFAYISCCENGLFGLQYLCEMGLTPSYVVTIPPEVGARNQVSGYVDFRPFCSQRAIKCIVLSDYNLAASQLPSEVADLLVVNGWNRLISKEVLARFAKGGVAIHAGHPPIGLGRAPLPWSLIKGLLHIEVYVFAMTDRADDGDIVAFKAVEITQQDTIQTLYEKVMLRGAQMFAECLIGLSKGVWQLHPQNLKFAVHFPKRTPEDGKIDFTLTCEELFNFVRAQSKPYPGAFFESGVTRYRVWRAIPFDRHYDVLPDRHPGKVLMTLPSGVVVQTGTTPIWLTEVTLDSGEAVDWSAPVFSKGNRLGE